jgi:Bifunctional DNA primase/polymerase, N-terminal
MSITFALNLAKQGIACFPCLETKRPATPHGFKDAKRDHTEVELLWRQFPGPLIGVPTGGINGFDVVDIDPRHGGMTWWEANQHALPPTRIHRTRSGGFHIFFRHQHDVRNSESRLAAGVDTRGEGGYIILWPVADCDALDTAEIADWPRWLISDYRRATAPVPRPVPSPAPALGPASTHEAARARLMIAKVLYRLMTAAEGERHYRLRAAACTVGGLLDIADIGEREAHQRLVEAALQAGAEDRTNAEKTAAWGLARGRQSPLSLGAGR